MKGTRSRFARKLAAQEVGGAPFGDAEAVQAVSGGTVALGADYRSVVTTAGSAAEEIVQLPAPTVVGQRKLVVFGAEGNGSDVVRINALSGDQIVREGFAFDGVSGFGEELLANVDLTAPNAAALFEYRGVSGSTDTWHLLYTTGSVSLS